MRRLPVVSLLHTSPAHVPLFERLAVELASQGGPEVRLSHMVRADLLARAMETGRLPADTHERAVRLMHAATASSDVVLCTCSTLGPAADAAAARAGKPVLRIDRPMARAAVRGARAIAVLATLACTLEPSATLLAGEARAAGVACDVAPVLVEGAWAAADAGDAARAAELVREQAALAAAAGAEAIVLAQVSMAGMVDATGLRSASPAIQGAGAIRGAGNAAPGGVRVLESPLSGLAAALAVLG